MNTSQTPPTPSPTTAPETPIRLNLPQPIYDRYAAAAKSAGVTDVESYIRQQLISCVDHDQNAASLHFNAPLAQRLCALTGKGVTADPLKVLEKLEKGSSIAIGKVTLPLDADLKERVSHNYLVRKNQMTAEEFILSEAVNSVRASVGLSRKPIPRRRNA